MNSGISELFRRQYGAISRADATALGLTRRQIVQRVRSGLWVEAKPGVYRNAASPITPELLIMEAILSAGSDSFASHGSAAYLWSMLTWKQVGERAAVTVAGSRNPRRYGFDVHRTSNPQWERVRRWKGIDCTDPLRTLIDVSAVVAAGVLDSAIDRSLSSGLVTVAGLQQEIGRRSVQGRNGLGILRGRLKVRGFSGALARVRLKCGASSSSGPTAFPLSAERSSPDPTANTEWTSSSSTGWLGNSTGMPGTSAQNTRPGTSGVGMSCGQKVGSFMSRIGDRCRGNLSSSRILCATPSLARLDRPDSSDL